MSGGLDNKAMCQKVPDWSALEDMYSGLAVYTVKILQGLKNKPIEVAEVRKVMGFLIEELIYKTKFGGDDSKYFFIFIPYTYMDEENILRLHSSENAFFPHVLERVKDYSKLRVRYTFLPGKDRIVVDKYKNLIDQNLCTSFEEIDQFIEDNYAYIG